MSQPYIGEIRMFAGNFAPAGWSFCDGQLVPISENDTLFNLIGTTYGGDGQETFALPNLQSRVPVHAGTGNDGIAYALGEAGGVEQVTITAQTTPLHSHAILAATGGQQLSPLPANTCVLADPSGGPQGVVTYINEVATQPLLASACSPAGGSQPHENMQPYLVISFIISLFGIYPTQN
ncbi:MAG TPA: tail fiber protein [Allosphingosinicella sp.]|nr:tail fiber protein [Allosphingosinicella sp.]